MHSWLRSWLHGLDAGLALGLAVELAAQLALESRRENKKMTQLDYRYDCIVIATISVFLVVFLFYFSGAGLRVENFRGRVE